MEPWTRQERQKLKELHVSSSRSSPEKLAGLIKHFKESGSVNEVVKVGVLSRGLARIIRDLTVEGDLEWVLRRETKDRPRRDIEQVLPVVDLRHHQRALLGELLSLEGLDAFPPRGHDLQIWLSRPDEPSWPVAKGFVERDETGIISIRLEVEDKVEWLYIGQHLDGDQLWEILDAWKSAMVDDFASRQNLYVALIEHTEGPIIEGGTGLSVSRDQQLGDQPGRTLLLDYIHTIYDQVFCQLIGSNRVPKTRNEFRHDDQGKLYWWDVLMGVNLSREQADMAVEHLLSAQNEYVKLPEATEAGDAYSQVLVWTDKLKRRIHTIRISPGFPGVCDLCRSTVDQLQKQ